MAKAKPDEGQTPQPETAPGSTAKVVAVTVFMHNGKRYDKGADVSALPPGTIESLLNSGDAKRVAE